MTRCAQIIPAPGGNSYSNEDEVACGVCDASQVRKVEASQANAEEFLRRAFESAVKHLFHRKGFANRAVVADWNVIACVSKGRLDFEISRPVPMRPAQRPEQFRATVENLLTSSAFLGSDRLPRQCSGSEFNVKSVRPAAANRRRPATAAGCCRRIFTSRDAWVF